MRSFIARARSCAAGRAGALLQWLDRHGRVQQRYLADLGDLQLCTDLFRQRAPDDLEAQLPLRGCRELEQDLAGLLGGDPVVRGDPHRGVERRRLAGGVHQDPAEGMLGGRVLGAPGGERRRPHDEPALGQPGRYVVAGADVLDARLDAELALDLGDDGGRGDRSHSQVALLAEPAVVPDALAHAETIGDFDARARHVAALALARLVRAFVPLLVLGEHRQLTAAGKRPVIEVAARAQRGFRVQRRAAHAVEVVVLRVAQRAVLHPAEAQVVAGASAPHGDGLDVVAGLAGDPLGDGEVTRAQTLGERRVAVVASRAGGAGALAHLAIARSGGRARVRGRRPLAVHLVVALRAPDRRVGEQLPGAGGIDARGVDERGIGWCRRRGDLGALLRVAVAGGEQEQGYS